MSAWTLTRHRFVFLLLDCTLLMRLLMRHCETLQNGVNDASEAISCMKDADRHLSSPSTSMAVEQIAILIVENAGTIKEDVNELWIKCIR
ncbi:hypothetical protein TSUD_323910 [Trifolium subterraneum]|uniref:Uncharacterized protein n=1 Tax=Trifolium subterraneum TaxID=3900 RepID=A0A2Z6MRH9_TRISU|nr:hypothetical protein TSUD_323910 [Trifolium subterraneum]